MNIHVFCPTINANANGPIQMKIANIPTKINVKKPLIHQLRHLMKTKQTRLDYIYIYIYIYIHIYIVYIYIYNSTDIIQQSRDQPFLFTLQTSHYSTFTGCITYITLRYCACIETTHLLGINGTQGYWTFITCYLLHLCSKRIMKFTFVTNWQLSHAQSLPLSVPLHSQVVFSLLCPPTQSNSQHLVNGH